MEIQVLFNTKMVTKEITNLKKVLIPILKAYIVFFKNVFIKHQPL